MKGNCPFYDDSSGSFMVYPSKEFFKCFGCGVEGGAAEFEKAVKGKPTH
jgi:DNA primase